MFLAGKEQAGLSSLIRGVLLIIGARAQEKMLRVATWRIIAGMANQKIARLFFVMKKPSNPVRHIGNIVTGVKDMKYPIPFTVPRALPFPAFIVSLYFDIAPKLGDFFLRKFRYLLIHGMIMP